MIHAYSSDVERAVARFRLRDEFRSAGPEPDVNIFQISRVAPGTEHDTGPVSAQFAVEVKNTMAQPVILRRVAVQSIGGGSYTLPSYS